MASSELVWQLVKGYNSFQVKGLHGAVFSTEPTNLYNKSSYKYSGIANKSVVGVNAVEGGVEITQSRLKNSNKPGQAFSKQVTKKNFKRSASSLSKVVSKVRPDLKKAALARLSAIKKSQAVAKSRSA